MKKWGLADSAACECGEPEQTADHIINSCPLYRPPNEAGLFEVGPLTRAWLQQTELTITDDERRRRLHNINQNLKSNSATPTQNKDDFLPGELSLFIDTRNATIPSARTVRQLKYNLNSRVVSLASIVKYAYLHVKKSSSGDIQVLRNAYRGGRVSEKSITKV